MGYRFGSASRSTMTTEERTDREAAWRERHNSARRAAFVKFDVAPA